ncbi:MAG: tetratricopeptide repeat protein, partial [Phycisphaerales bacterium JB059]
THAKLLQLSGRSDEAAERLERAIAIDPDLPDAHMTLGACLQHTDRLDDALCAMRRAVELRPDHTESRVNLGLLHLDRGEAGEAVDTLREATRLDPSSVLAWDTLALALNYDHRAAPEDTFRAHQRFGELLERSVRPFAAHANDRRPERPLRVGYLSRDMRRHSVAYFLQTILDAHDPARVESYCYSTTLAPDDMTAHLRALAGVWRDAGALDDLALAERIRSDRIDVLVELSGHFSGHRLALMAMRPAPVQVTYLGYPATTGLRRIDARLVDAHTDPAPGADAFATERLVRLDPCFLSYAPPPEAPGAQEPVSPPPCERAGHVTFGSFNDLKKLAPPTLDAWASLLERVPGSRLILKNRGFDTPALRARIESMLAERGVAPDRVELIAHIPSLREHLELYARIDLALESFPYHGTTTTCEALWMGVPVLTLAGASHASRVGVSLLSAVGLPELIATDPDDFVERGVALARDPGRLAALRAPMRSSMAQSPLCDASGFTRRLESAYHQLFTDWLTSTT